MIDPLREKLAAWAHNSGWTGWAKCMLEVLDPLLRSAGNTPKHEGDSRAIDALQRWDRQTRTLYSDLTDEEKFRGRCEAEEILGVLRQQGMFYKIWIPESQSFLSDEYGKDLVFDNEEDAGEEIPPVTQCQIQGFVKLHVYTKYR